MITDDNVYPSKKGLIVYALFIVLAAVEIIYLLNKQYSAAIICLVLTGIIVFPIVFNTVYTITGNALLRIKCGFFVNLTIPVNAITRIQPTNSILSAPALSMDRLEVFYNRYDCVVISPVNREDFINALKNINPAIEYISKTR